MTAKEMFEKANYKLNHENMNYISYIDDLGRIIKFDKIEYIVEKYIEDNYGNKQQLGWINKKEIQAINQQMKELEVMNK